MCALSWTTSDFRLVICPANIPICPWTPSSRGAGAPLITATIAFASDDSCKPGATSVIGLQRACTTASVVLPICLLAHVGPLHNVFSFSNSSSFQNSGLLVFCSRDLLATTDLVQILRLLLESPCLGPDIARGKFWLFQRRRARYTLPRHSAPITTVPTSVLCHRSQIHCFSPMLKKGRRC